MCLEKKWLEVQEMPRTGYCMFRSRQGIPGRDRVLFLFCVAIEILVSRHGYQILRNRNWHNMALFVAIGILVLCREDVTKKVSLSRQRRS